jgi:asparagine synthase (glutamine-hydrolysing)
LSIAGYISLSRSYVPLQQLQQSLARLAYGAPTGAKNISAAEAAIGGLNAFAILHSRPDQPEIFCCFDGALFEKGEMRARLRLPPESNDAEIAASAYLQWGEEFARELDGEFALSLWDGARRCMLLVRDALGRYPLFYSVLADGFCFASEPRGLAGWEGVDAGIEDEMIARLLSLTPAPGKTLYRSIVAVPGGHVVVLESGKAARSVRYWHPLQTPELRLKDWRGYSEALHEAMVRAVSVRLPAEGLVGAHLSSGFDSSSVAALAAQALARQNRPLVAYTSVPVHRINAKDIRENRFADEWPLAAQAAAMYPNIEHVAIPTNGADWWNAIDLMGDFAGTPVTSIRNTRWYYGISKDAHDRGLVSMFEGQAGNLTGSYSGGLGLYDLRRKRRWGELVRAIRSRRQQKEPWPALIQSVWMPSEKAKQRVQRLRGRKMPRLFDVTLMRADFYKQSGLQLRDSSPLGTFIEGDRSGGAAWRLSILEAGDFGMMTAMQMRAFGLRREDPTADRRLVELCLSIPDEAFAPGGIKRELYREAFRNDLPAELLAEPLRGLQSSDFLVMFEDALPEWHAEMERLEQSAVVGRYLDLPRMRKLLEDWPRMKAGPPAVADQAYSYTFGGALALGRFLRRLEASGAR